MKDSTKHIIAKEVVFFVKWLLIGGIIALITYFLATSFDLEGGVSGAIINIGIFLPVIAYAIRGIKWLMEWK